MVGSSTTLFHEHQHYGYDHESRYCKLDWLCGDRFEQDDPTQKDASTTGNTSCDDSVGQLVSIGATTMDTSTSFQLERHHTS